MIEGIHKGKKGVSPVVATIMMITLTVILSTAIVAYIGKLGAFKRVPIATLDFEAYKVGSDYVLVVSNLGGDTLNTGELMVRVRGDDAEAVWDVPELAPGAGAEAKLGVVLYLGNEVAIVHESGYVYRKKTLTEIKVVAPTTLVVSPSSFVVTSGGTADLEATLSSGGNPVAGKLVTWSASAGTVSPERCTTNSSGLVFTTYTPPKVGDQTWVTITASFAGDSNYFRISDRSSGAVLPLPKPTEEFVITADRVVMTDWSIEGPIDLGSPMVTMITAQRQELTNLHLSRFEVHADSFTGTSVVVYATYVSGTSYGKTLAWTGDQPIPPAIGFLPRKVEIENVYLHVVRVEANVEIEGVRMGIHPDLTDEFLVTALGVEDGVRMENWSVKGPVEYEGRQVMMIVGDQYLQNLYQSRFEVRADSLSATGTPENPVVVYATYVQSDVFVGDVRLTSDGGVKCWARRPR